MGGIGLYRIATDYYTQPLLQSSEVTTAEFITGPLTAKTGELCVFKLNNTVTKADWVIVPPVNVY
ncbi:MAG: hypothetical protein LBJ67_06125, partial [Planctomycetaceae bacterium]|nr:hypothetical protein [Planctomycetaceae bacterium]